MNEYLWAVLVVAVMSALMVLGAVVDAVASSRRGGGRR